MRLPTRGRIYTLIDIKEMNKMVDAFIERGFTYFDTAYMYHALMSEPAAYKSIVKRYPRDSFTLTTKLPTMMLITQSDQKRIFESQLKKCGVDFFDYYLLHSLGEANYKTAQKFGSFEFVSKMKAEGKIKQIGFSFHDSPELLDRILTEHPETELVQLQLNYLDWENETIQSRKCLEVAQRHGKPVVVMEPVKGGTLANLPAQAQELFKAYAPDASPASWAIRFAASQPGVMTVLSGMHNMEQLLDNTGYMAEFKPLSGEEMQVINSVTDIINASIAVPCTACGYCTAGCPKHIPIPKYFALYNAEKQDDKKGFRVQKTYYSNMTKTLPRAKECISCRKCEQQCPQHIKISEFMKDVSKTFD